MEQDTPAPQDHPLLRELEAAADELNNALNRLEDWLTGYPAASAVAGQS
ncbi:hypothetical protein QWY84_11520 [Aquisalimonas lutea]|nr:hypothetical protein [Aquisalimonas lutea]MDN3518242.1 hypothetical protein [Aquisalimonas lutea]